MYVVFNKSKKAGRYWMRIFKTREGAEQRARLRKDSGGKTSAVPIDTLKKLIGNNKKERSKLAKAMNGFRKKRPSYKFD